MMPHKSAKGLSALERLKVFDGIPYPYDQKKRLVVPEALKVLRLKAHRDSTVLGELASHMGWNRKDVVETLEAKRKVKSEKYW
jgi:large subunit ribosomal protein L13Ae